MDSPGLSVEQGLNHCRQRRINDPQENCNHQDKHNDNHRRPISFLTGWPSDLLQLRFDLLEKFANLEIHYHNLFSRIIVKVNWQAR